VLQKLKNDQLREAYFKNHTTLKSFDVRDPNKLSTRIEHTKVSYEKFNDHEINRFANLINTFINSDPKSPIINLEHSDQYVDSLSELPEVETRPTHYYGSHNNLFNLPVDEETKSITNSSDTIQVSRLEIDLRAQMQAQEKLIREMRAQLELAESLAAELKTPAPTEYVLTDEDDFYLESTGDGHSASAQNSLADIFAEITSNEKDSVSNYEPSIFDANVEQLFAEGEDLDKDPSFTDPRVQTSVLDTAIPELSPLPDLNFEQITPIIELPPMPQSPPMVETPSFDLSDVEIKLELQLPAFDLPMAPTFEALLPSFELTPLPETTVEATIPDFELPPLPELGFLNRGIGIKKERILDGMLIIVLLAIISVLAFYFLLY